MKTKTLALVLAGFTAAVVLRALLAPDGPFRYVFIVPNVLLAAVPLLLAPLFLLARRHLGGGSARVAAVFLAVVWLLFLPNAFYLLTDFMHLNPDVLVNAPGGTATYALRYGRGEGLYLYDALLLFAATVFGAYAGGLALWRAYRWLRSKTSPTLAGAGLAAIMVASAIGVYIGRFMRWNSWEGLTQPHRILLDLLSDLHTPAELRRFLFTLLVMLIFQAASFLYMRRQKSSG